MILHNKQQHKQLLSVTSYLVRQRCVRIIISAGDAVLITDPVNLLHQRNNRLKLFVCIADPTLELIMIRYQLLHAQCYYKVKEMYNS